ncbi:phosphotransferase [Microbacterium caowuchunii]|uniref:Phosphotransferase n=2 Tax=Microbacterium caowuchunii TaxID=2614638 RepID=A0A5N0TFN5_9MICO|nr:phosphotransferase [Microbacterium caowuchunii]
MNKRGDLLLFNVRNASVTRVFPSDDLVKTYLENRDTVARYLPIPQTLRVGDRVVSEVLVSGKNGFSVGTESKLLLWRKFLAAYEDLSTAATNDAGLIIAELRAEISELQPHHGPLQSTEKMLSTLNSSWRTFAMHGDLSGNNVVVDGNSFVVIDYDDVARHPFFFDVILFTLRDDVLRSMLRRGMFDEDLKRLADAAGADFSSDHLQSWINYVVLRLAADRCRATFEELESALKATRERLVPNDPGL